MAIVIGVLPQDLMKDTNDRSQLQDGVANHFHEAMLVKFLKSNDEEMQECVVPTGSVECTGPYLRAITGTALEPWPNRARAQSKSES